ncbi:MAG TPA: hypothetical protein VFP72_10170, partial [Kineosporiaceae bacterium]|nr:hypothetical protein [Kineosporiaceae bacterium]
MVTTIDRSELALVWPAQLFAAEARALLAAGYTDENSLGLLLDEAFADERALKLFRSVQSFDPPRPGDPWAEQLEEDPWVLRLAPAGVRLVQDLVGDAEAGRLPRFEPRR